ncbi:MAG: hypothetical protein ACXABK_00460 [Candidatus Heimdallarchaeaceae archaeon]
MVSILQALKVSLLFLILGVIPLIAALLGLLAIIALQIDPGGGLNLGFVVLGGAPYIWVIVMAVGFLIFFVGLFKAIGDITEAALIE